MRFLSVTQLLFSLSFLFLSTAAFSQERQENNGSEDFFEEEDVKLPSPDLTKETLRERIEQLQNQAQHQAIIPPQNDQSTIFIDDQGRVLPAEFYSAIFTVLHTKGLLETLRGPFTIILATDEALHRVPIKMIKNIFSPQYAELLARFVGHHVVARKIERADFKRFNNREIKTIGGHNLTLSDENGVLTLDNIRVVKIEPLGNKGTVLLLDGVFFPETFHP